jgi:1-deoxy-D-xylulose-5-phosphate reductoisomerase
MLKRIAILGSTGSIGTQALDVIAAHPDKFSATVLAAHHNDQLLETQIHLFKPDIAILTDHEAATRLKSRYKGKTKIMTGEEGLIAGACHDNVDTVLTSMVGFAGLTPTLAAIKAKKTIALANKETLVAAGELVTKLAKDNGVAILPVDSEHSAIFQCLNGEKHNKIHKIILTASGGPFRGRTREDLRNVSIADCLNHPNWSMGKKITIDSATLVNKGLEVIEARWLFNVNYDQIEVVVHPQSIIHSAVEFEDGAVIAQLGLPDMRIPIQYAFSYPARLTSDKPRLELSQIAALTFSTPDRSTFPGLDLAFMAGKTGGSLPCVFNAANEVAVYAFLAGKIAFLDITTVITYVMDRHQIISQPSITDLYAADEWSRQTASQAISDMR